MTFLGVFDEYGEEFVCAAVGAAGELFVDVSLGGIGSGDGEMGHW